MYLTQTKYPIRTRQLLYKNKNQYFSFHFNFMFLLDHVFSISTIRVDRVFRILKADVYIEIGGVDTETFVYQPRSGPITIRVAAPS